MTRDIKDLRWILNRAVLYNNNVVVVQGWLYSGNNPFTKYHVFEPFLEDCIACRMQDPRDRAISMPYLAFFVFVAKTFYC